MRKSRTPVMTGRGRPAKAGGNNAIPINLRIDPEDYEALAGLASRLRSPGRPVPSVQDVIRKMVRFGLYDEDFIGKLSSEKVSTL